MDRLVDLCEQVERGEFLRAIRTAGQLMLLPDLSPRELGRLFRLSGRARAESGDPYGGLKLLELAISWAMRARDWDCVGMARAELGISWLSVGDLPSAVECLQAYLLDLERYDEAKSYVGHVHYNLGLACRRKRDHIRALIHYQAAVEWFTEKGYTLQAGQTHQNIAWLHCLEGNVEEAEQELRIAESFADICGTEFRVEQLVCRAHLHKVRGQVVEAMQLVREVLQPSRPGVLASHKAYAAWIAGSVALVLRHWDQVRFFANLTVHYAMEARDTGAMSLASQLKAELDRRRKADEAAG